jgi:hypothetical protein
MVRDAHGRGVAPAFMTRTWYFTGRFSLFCGTALRHNDTGLRPWHVFDTEVWSKVAHSLAGLVFMKEPPHVDPRAALAHAHGYPARFTVHLIPLASAPSVAAAAAMTNQSARGYVNAIAASTSATGFTGSDWRASHNNGRCTPVT